MAASAAPADASPALMRLLLHEPASQLPSWTRHTTAPVQEWTTTRGIFTLRGSRRTHTRATEPHPGHRKESVHGCTRADLCPPGDNVVQERVDTDSQDEWIYVVRFRKAEKQAGRTKVMRHMRCTSALRLPLRTLEVRELYENCIRASFCTTVWHTVPRLVPLRLHSAACARAASDCSGSAVSRCDRDYLTKFLL